MSSGKDSARDARYGRRGGGWLPTEKPVKEGGPFRPHPVSAAALRAHMMSAHGDITESEPDGSDGELRQWHDADHARCGADSRHRHDK